MSYYPVILNSKTIDRAGSAFCTERLWCNKLSADDPGRCFQNTTTRSFRLIAMASGERCVRDCRNFGIPTASSVVF
jgi:hypothetical protein